MLQIEVMGDRADVAEPGMLASAIIDESSRLDGLTASAVRVPSDQFDVLVYARRVPDTLAVAVDACRRGQKPLLLLSTSMPDLSAVSFPLVLAPNASIEALSYIDKVVKAAEMLPSASVVITEHHQPSKKDTSGTAKMIARMIGANRTKIVSIRDWEHSKREYGLDESARSGYAVHSTMIEGMTEPLEVVLQGRQSYAIGALTVAKQLARLKISDGLHVLDAAFLRELGL